MHKLELHFLKSGLQTTIQDKGRVGFQHMGIPFGGPMDEKSARGANWLIGNPYDAPLLEITIVGPKILFKGSGSIAITGANLTPSLNKEVIPLNQTLQIGNGDVLTFGKCQYGCRCYLAVAGIWQIEKWQQSTSALNEIFTPNSIIKKDDVISIDTHQCEFKSLSASQQMIFPKEVRIKIRKGPEFDAFSTEEKTQFLENGHIISNEANRMGYRLNTRLKPFKTKQELISSGVIPGTIQISNQGQPIILMKDAQTTGGYPRIANVLETDQNILGQLKPGDKVWFSLV